MKIIKDNEELKSYIVDGVISFECSIECNFNIDVNASINAHDIKALDINSDDINAHNIKALDINSHDINARDIDSQDINAYGIKAHDIRYYAFCISYTNIICESIEGERAISFHKCLDGKLTIKEKLKEIKIKDLKIMLSVSEINELKNQLK